MMPPLEMDVHQMSAPARRKGSRRSREKANQDDFEPSTKTAIRVMAAAGRAYRSLY